MYTTRTDENNKQFEESKFIAPGVNEVKITKIEAMEPDGKASYINLTFENTKGQTTEGKLYMSEAARTQSEKIVGGMKTALGITEDISGKTLTEWASKLYKAIGNKTFRHRFTGEEVQGKLNTETGEQKKNWFKPIIGRFANNSEAISTNPSRLKPLDKTNQYDWKTLPTADNVGSTSASSSDDLPF